MARVLLGMSGGVDSSVSALLLRQQGHEVLGCCLLLAPQTSADDARTAAAQMNIPFHVVDAREAFERDVMEPFVAQYRCGLTPSPCVHCNRTCKFPLLLRTAHELGCDAIATGHYARVQQDAASGRWQLLRGLNAHRDQSYMLCGLSQEMLSRLLFPLGDFDKNEVRALAHQAGLTVASKSDSQDLCFVPDGDHLAFLARRGVVDAPGDIVDAQGRVLGQHKGLHRYTQGQRKGIEIPGPYPYYVLDKDIAGNKLVIGTADELGLASCLVNGVNWITPTPAAPIRARVKVRYRQTAVPATVKPLPDAAARVRFDTPMTAIAPGQACVFYGGDLVLGGGIIAPGPR
ncbi:MAG: tRNA 2-thiouridine(34) synthase MnmA [Coriobacteriales bacterium]|nr:tRNA 2-thiouridine(34) synthase MnmA [Coriobacteriales bacterium]MBQ6586253.1 tRNA 2-thiouridine(34) synthase MnmA [Coriobacteriales bacterium]